MDEEFEQVEASESDVDSTGDGGSVVNMPVAQTRLETLQICKLLQCVREEDRVQVEKLCSSGVPHLINYNEPNNGDTALNIAAAANNDSMVEFLLELDAHPDVVDYQGRAPIMRAAEYGHVQCMEVLAKAEANMRIRDIEGKGVIYYCISPTERHRKCLEIVLEHGADVNNVHNDGMPEIVFACESAGENEELCLKLISKGADINAKHSKSNRTALMAACTSGSAKVARAILERNTETINETMTGRPKYTAVHEAAKGGHLECLKVLSAYGANFDVYDEQLNNPIHLAATAGHDMVCKFLGQRGCNPKPKNSEGNVAKNLAKEGGHKAAMKEIKKVEKSFGKTGKNNDPWAIALYDFCVEKQSEILEICQNYDADGSGTVPQADLTETLTNMGAPMPDEGSWKTVLNAHDKDRQNVVDYNDFLGAKKWVNKLFLMSAFEGKKKKKKGGKGKKKKGKTKVPMPVCIRIDQTRQLDGGPAVIFQPRHIHFTDVGRFDRDKPPEHPLQDDSGWYLTQPDKAYISMNDASKHRDLETLKDAFGRGIHVDTRDKYFKTPLMIAAVNGNIDMVQYLVEKGASVNAEDNFKWTPLHFACHAGMLDIVMYLLDKGSNLEAKTMNEATPLMRAIESSNPQVVQYLIDKGAKVMIENKKGQNPVDIAAAWADSRVYDIVRAKYDSLPVPNDKKKGGKGGKGGAKGGKSTPVVTDKPQAHPESPRDIEVPHRRQRKGSILRAASALAGGIEEIEDITYTPKKVWTQQKTTEDLLCERVVRRERFTWEVDFPDFEMPFLKNVSKRVEEEGGFDDEE